MTKDDVEKWVLGYISPKAWVDTLDHFKGHQLNLSICKRLIREQDECYSSNIEAEIKEIQDDRKDKEKA